jgi:Core-2/I-Branching enzyme
MRCLAMSAVIPFLFVVRHRKSLFRPTATRDQASRLASEEQPSSYVLPDPHIVYQFLSELDFQENLGERRRVSDISDVVELRHCLLPDTGTLWDSQQTEEQFRAWSYPILQKVVPEILQQQAMDMNRSWAIKEATSMISDYSQAVTEELVLQLLEIYLTHNIPTNNNSIAYMPSQCQFDAPWYRPSVPQITDLSRIEQSLRVASETYAHSEKIRIVFCIVVYRDAPHVERLVQALLQPQHYIVLHVERRSPPEFVAAMHQLASRHGNQVVVLQFGTILYRTDSVSQVNFRIMKWVLQDLKLEYDYHVMLDGSSFPLYSGPDLVSHLAQNPTPVLLGEMTHQGERIQHKAQFDYLQRKRLLVTGGNLPKATKRLDRSLLRDVSLPPVITEHMQYKSFSGNQGVYHRSTAEALVSSPDVNQLFAIAKYGCCCCLEERTWIAALSMIGLGSRALSTGSTWQLWGGDSVDCKATMHNAVIHSNSSVCFRLQDATLLQHSADERAIGIVNATLEAQHRPDGITRTKPVQFSLYIRGHEIMHYLRDARRRGFLFARKFDSTHGGSMVFLQRIVQEMHFGLPYLIDRDPSDTTGDTGLGLGYGADLAALDADKGDHNSVLVGGDDAAP